VEPAWPTIERTPPPTPPSEPPAPARARGSTIAQLLIVGLVVLVLGVAYQGGLIDNLTSTFNSAANGVDTTVPSTADIPPAGTVWFGDTFDPSTFEIANRATTGKVGDTLAFVGHLTERGSGIQVRLTMADTTTTVPSDDIPDGSDIAGGTLNLLFAGPMRVEFVDVGGNVLASGTLQVSG